MIKKEDVFKIGQFAKPHGIKGEIALVTNSDVFDDSDDPYIICEMDGILVPFFIEEYRYKTDTVILLKLKNVDDEKAAREFSNREVFYSLDEVDRDDLVGDMTWDSFIVHILQLQKDNGVSPDIRAGIALLIAAMSAEGTSHIHNIDQIDRGYQNIDKRLNGIGARITRL